MAAAPFAPQTQLERAAEINLNKLTGAARGVLEVFDPPRETEHCLLTNVDCEKSMACRIRTLFDEVDEVTRCTFASVSLETLTR